MKIGKPVYGADGRIAILVPPSNTVNEAEFARFAPDSVAVLAHRVPLHLGSGRVGAIEADIAAACDMVKPARPDVAVYACTLASISLPDGSVPALLAQQGLQGFGTAEALLAAFKALRPQRIGIVAPYSETVTRHEADWFAGKAFEVGAVVAGGIEPKQYHMLCTVWGDWIAEQAAEVARAGADAVFLSCTDMPSLHLITAIEAEIGCPVVTSNSATLWHALQMLSVVPPPALGRLAKL